MTRQKPAYSFCSTLGNPTSLPDFARIFSEQPEECDQLVVEIGDRAWHVVKNETIEEAVNLGVKMQTSGCQLHAHVVGGVIEVDDRYSMDGPLGWDVVWFSRRQQVMLAPRPIDVAIEDAQAFCRALQKARAAKLRTKVFRFNTRAP